MSDTRRIGNGKGSKRRPGDDEAFRSNWDRIFNQKEASTDGAEQDQAASAAT